MKELLKRFVREEEGQDIIEYVLLAAGISIVAIAVINLIGPLVNTRYENVRSALAATPGTGS